MLRTVKEDILDVLSKSVEILKTDEHPEEVLSELSDHVIHDASIFQDDDSVSIAVLIYALAKTIGDCIEKNVDYSRLIKSLEKARDLLSKNDFKRYRTTVRETFNKIRQLNKKVGVYIHEALDRARIKKGSKMHEHGISIARTAELLGITHWELQDYIGKQKYFDIKEMPVRQRLKTAREIFK